MTNFIRRKVSLKKKRFQEDGFDLDLAYITPNLIAMGFPAEGIESLYRNPMSSVKRFLERRHSEQYKVYNLCIEREYDVAHFHNRVGCYKFFDHSAPPLATIGDFCADVLAWLQSGEGHTAAVHCKAGKGRAGMMVCCFLMHARIAQDPEEAMSYFARQRTHDLKGVTIPSQKRYIGYYHDIITFGFPSEPPIRIKKVRLHTAKYATKDAAKAAPYMLIVQGSIEQKLILQTPPAVLQDGWSIISFNRGVPVQGDVKLIFYDKVIGGKKEICHLWFNTGFIQDNSLKLMKHELDKCHHDKKHKVFLPDFEIDIIFKDAKVSSMQRLKRAARRSARPGSPGTTATADDTSAAGSTPASPASQRWAERAEEIRNRERQAELQEQLSASAAASPAASPVLARPSSQQNAVNS